MGQEVRIPRLGWSMEEGTFVRWLKQDGELVQVGEPLFELEGEKSTQEVESLDSGILRVAADAPAPGETVPVGTLLGYLVPEDQALSWTPPRQEAADQRRESADVEHKSAATIAAEVSGPMARSISSPRAVSTPRARRVATELGIDWRPIAGTGKGGRVREADIRAAATARTTVTSSIEHRSRAEINRPIALAVDADASRLVCLRDQFLSRGETEPGASPTATEIAARVAVTVLGNHPLVAARSRQRQDARPAEGRPVGIALDTEHGLMAFMIPEIARMSLNEFVHHSRNMLKQAERDHALLREIPEGSFTIIATEVVTAGSLKPFLSTPGACVLMLGGIERQAVVLDDDCLGVRDQLTIQLLVDGGEIDEVTAARFLEKLCLAIENPGAWLG